MGPEGSDTHVTTRVMGTYGYAAPEYISTGKFPILFLSGFQLQILRAKSALRIMILWYRRICLEMTF